MTAEQIFLFALLALFFGFLVWGRFRYDLVAFSALVVAGIAGVIPADRVFAGFGHPAVLIIALVLIVSRGLSASGAIDLLSGKILSASQSLRAHIGIMAGLAAALSTFMNNVAALAMLIPLDLKAAQKAGRSPALTLMPLSFASILGGMVTLIGTPPNIVIATFREGALGEPFRMFDFAPVGGGVALAGVLFVALVGWRLIPVERSTHDAPRELEDLEDYLAEVKVPEASAAVDKPLRDLEDLAAENDVQLVGLVRRGKRLPGSARREVVRKNDLVVVQGAPGAIDQFAGAAGMTLTTSEKHAGVAAESLALMEAVVPQGARIEGRSAMDVRLLYRRGVTLLGISRRGQHLHERLRKTPIQAGDILLLMGPDESLGDAVEWLGCLPLAGRGLQVTQRRKAWLAIGLFGAAIAAASFGLLYLPVALALVVVAYVGLRIVPLTQVYDAVEWPVIVLLGSLIPLGVALEQSGGTALVANAIVNLSSGLPAVAVLAILMVVTMTLSDVLNNVATALIAAPIAIDIAHRLDANPDTFLMGVAVAASCAFLTPIGHKNNTLILGPGGYRFGDYWRMGLPLEGVVLLVSLPLLLLVWPL